MKNRLLNNEVNMYRINKYFCIICISIIIFPGTRLFAQNLDSCANIDDLSKQYVNVISCHTQFEVCLNPNFEYKQFYNVLNDTIEIYDYWITVQWPDGYIINASVSNDTVTIAYEEMPGAVREMGSCVETHFKLELCLMSDNFILHFEPSGLQTGTTFYDKSFRDSNKDYYIELNKNSTAIYVIEKFRIKRNNDKYFLINGKIAPNKKVPMIILNAVKR